MLLISSVQLAILSSVRLFHLNLLRMRLDYTNLLKQFQISTSTYVYITVIFFNSSYACRLYRSVEITSNQLHYVRLFHRYLLQLFVCMQITQICRIRSFHRYLLHFFVCKQIMQIQLLKQFQITYVDSLFVIGFTLQISKSIACIYYYRFSS